MWLNPIRDNSKLLATSTSFTHIIDIINRRIYTFLCTDTYIHACICICIWINRSWKTNQGDRADNISGGKVRVENGRTENKSTGPFIFGLSLFEVNDYKFFFFWVSLLFRYLFGRKESARKCAYWWINCNSGIFLLKWPWMWY